MNTAVSDARRAAEVAWSEWRRTETEEEEQSAAIRAAYLTGVADGMSDGERMVLPLDAAAALAHELG